MRLLSLLVFTLVAAVSFAVESLAFSPVQEGAEWTTDVTVNTPQGRAIKTVTYRKILGQEERESKTYYRMRSWVEGHEAESQSILIRRDETGVFIAGLEQGAVEHTLLPFPVEVGKKWKTLIKGKEKRYEVVAFETQVIGENRYENCAKIKVTNANGEVVEEIWEAPGIGTVRSEVVFSDGSKVSLILREFNPGKK